LKLAVVGLLVPAVAAADYKSTKIAGTELVVASAGRGLVVRDRTRSAPFAIRPFQHGDLIVGVDSTTKGDAVTLQLDFNCGGGGTIATTKQALVARLENATALALHGKQKWNDAAAGFAKALALDPTFELAALNLASAQARGGHVKDAAATLTTLAQRDLPMVVWRIHADPDLAPVAPELASLELAGADAGTATHAADVAYSARRHLIAIGEHGGDPSGATWRTFRVVDAGTGKPIAMIGSERDAPATDKALAALGFARVADAELPAPGDDGKARFVFPGTKIGVVARHGHVTIATGNHVLGEGDIVDWPTRPRIALTPESAVVIDHVVVGEGCGGESYDEGVAIPLER
jgi:hypothetical protein